MPKITKPSLHLLKLFRENYWLLFSGHGVYTILQTEHQLYLMTIKLLMYEISSCKDTNELTQSQRLSTEIIYWEWIQQLKMYNNKYNDTLSVTSI